jgi:hypothetical protein
MSLETIFSKSWQEFKSNVKMNFKVSFWYFVLPMIILSLIVSIFLASVIPSNIGEIINSMNNTDSLNSTISPNSFQSDINLSLITGSVISQSSSLGATIGIFIIIFVILLIIAVIIFYLGYLNIVYASLYNEKGKLSLKEIKSKSKKYFWPFLGLTCLLMLTFYIILGVAIALGILFIYLFKDIITLGIILLIILIILGLVISYWLIIKWCFSPFILMRENQGIIESMKRSALMVKGKWWKVFGCMLLFVLIVSAISYVPSMFFSIVYMMFSFLAIFTLTLGGSIFAITLFIFLVLTSIFFGILWAFETSAMVLLFKNFYLELRTNKW